jgi:hypothetical protein
MCIPPPPLPERLVMKKMRQWATRKKLNFLYLNIVIHYNYTTMFEKLSKPRAAWIRIVLMRIWSRMQLKIFMRIRIVMQIRIQIQIQRGGGGGEVVSKKLASPLAKP